MSKRIVKLCGDCGKQIAEERLEAIPDAEYCVKCVDKNVPRRCFDPDELCAKASPSGQNGFAPKS